MKNALARMDWVLTEKRHADALDGAAGDALKLLFVGSSANPEEDASVSDLNLWAPDTDKLLHWPARIASFTQLQCLAIGPGVDAKVLKEIEVAAIPASVSALGVFMGGVAAKWPAKVCLPQIVDLRTDGPLSFTHANFPNLTAVSVLPDRTNKNIEAVLACENMSELQLLSIASPGLFSLAEHLPLRKLGLLGGKLDSLTGIGALSGVRSLRLHNLRWLKSISAIKELKNIEELEIRYCKQIQDIDCLVGLPQLKRLQLVACGKIGLQSILSSLSGIKQLEISATS